MNTSLIALRLIGYHPSGVVLINFLIWLISLYQMMSPKPEGKTQYRESRSDGATFQQVLSQP